MGRRLRSRLKRPDAPQKLVDPHAAKLTFVRGQHLKHFLRQVAICKIMKRNPRSLGFSPLQFPGVNFDRIGCTAAVHHGLFGSMQPQFRSDGEHLPLAPIPISIRPLPAGKGSKLSPVPIPTAAASAQKKSNAYAQWKKGPSCEALRMKHKGAHEADNGVRQT